MGKFISTGSVLLVAALAVMFMGCGEQTDEPGYSGVVAKQAGECPSTDVDKADDATVEAGVVLCKGAQIKSGALIEACTIPGLETVIGEDATIEEDAIIRACAHIGPGATIKKEAEVGAGTIIGADVDIEEEAVVGANCNIGDGAQVKKEAEVGDGASVGAGAEVSEEIVIPANAVVPEGGQVETEEDVVDLCVPSTTPLQVFEVVGGSLSFAPTPLNWQVFVSGRSVSGLIKIFIVGLINTSDNIWVPVHDPETLFTVQVAARKFQTLPQTSAGDSVTLVYGLVSMGPLFEIAVYFPEIANVSGESLYVADDGSTYYDRELTDLAANACHFQ